MLCLLEKERSGLCISFVGGSQAALALSAIAPRLTPPDYPHTILMAYQIYAGLSYVGGPDRSGGQAHLQFLPLTLPCSVPGLWVVHPHQRMLRNTIPLIYIEIQLD